MQNKPRSFVATFVFCMLFGWLGVDRFYLGQIGRGIGRILLGLSSFAAMLVGYILLITATVDGNRSGVPTWVPFFIFGLGVVFSMSLYVWVGIDLIRLLSTKTRHAHDFSAPHFIQVGTPRRRASVAVGLSFLGGYLGLDRFYLGRIFSGSSNWPCLSPPGRYGPYKQTLC